MANVLESLPAYLARNIQSLREKRRITQSALAALAGIPRSTVTHIESGEGNPSLSNLTRIADALQVSIEELLAPPRSGTRLVKASEVPARRRGAGPVTVFKLLPDAIPGMEIDRMELEPG